MANVLPSQVEGRALVDGNRFKMLDAAAGAALRHLPATLAILGCILLWQLVVWGFSVPTFMAPGPLDVIKA
ncbi:MAG: ABC transporter permease, partial [Ensifer adhaerens]